MATITYVESTTALAHRPSAVPPPVRTTDQLMFVVEYGEAFHLSVAMNALYQPLRETLARLPGWASATATRIGWQHLTAYLDWAGTSAWTAALQGKTERFALRDVSVDAAQGHGGLWMRGTAAFQGTWSASLGVDLVGLSGTTAVTLDGTPGLPGFLAPAVAVVGADQVPLHGVAQGSTWLGGREHLSLVTFDASIALDLERVYLAVAGIFYGDTFTWQEFLEGWEGPTEGKLRYDPVRASSHRKGPHGDFIFLGHIGQGKCAVHCQTLLRRVPTQQLQLGTDDALLRELCEELMPKKMRIDPLRNARGHGIQFDQLP